MEYKFPSIEYYIKNRERYTRPKIYFKKKKKSTSTIKYLSWEVLSQKSFEELINFDIRPLYKKEFVFLVSFISMSHPKIFPRFLRAVLKTHISTLTKGSLKKYFKEFKQQVRHTKQTIKVLKKSNTCDKKCRWCPLKSCIGGGGKGKIERLERWLRKPII